MLNLRDFNIKTFWVRLWFGFFVTYLLSETEIGIGISFKDYNFWMGIGMFLLSFPASYPFILFAEYRIRVDNLCDEHCGVAFETLIWLGIFAVGYLQWTLFFRVLKNIPTGLTALNLNGTAKIAPTATPPGLPATIKATPATRVPVAGLNR